MGIPVNYICQAAKRDHIFLQLKESRNEFTEELIANLRKAVATLTLRTYIKLRKE
jgi:hypothetical protein